MKYFKIIEQVPKEVGWRLLCISISCVNEVFKHGQNSRPCLFPLQNIYKFVGQFYFLLPGPSQYLSMILFLLPTKTLQIAKVCDFYK